MEMRRYYKKGIKYPYYVTETKINELRDKGFDEEYIDNYDTAEQEIVLNVNEQATWYTDCLIRVLANPSIYLDNLDMLAEFKVNWNNYSGRYIKSKCISCGKEHKDKKVKECQCGNKEFIRIHYGVGFL